MNAAEMLAVRDSLLAAVGFMPDAWFAELGLDADAVRELGCKTAAVATELSSSTYNAAGTAYCMGFALGAAVMREQLAGRSS